MTSGKNNFTAVSLGGTGLHRLPPAAL